MRRDQQRLTDVLEALDWIAKAIAGRAEADFLVDETLWQTATDHAPALRAQVAEILRADFSQ